MSTETDTTDEVVIFDRAQASPKLDDGQKDIGVFEQVYIHLPNAKIFGVLCLYIVCVSFPFPFVATYSSFPFQTIPDK